MNNKNLFVDLDGTLIKSDILYESLLNYFSKDTFAFFKCLYVFLFHGGILALKKYLYDKSEISFSTLPLNNRVLEYIEIWKKNNKGKVILISASDERILVSINKRINIFDNVHGSVERNLKGKEKLKKIIDIYGMYFDYIGNSFDDICIWKKSQQRVVVNSSIFLRCLLGYKKIKHTVIDTKKGIIKIIPGALRIHQWVKNLLIFVPLVLAQEYNTEAFIATLIGFFAFSFIASAFYIFNDLMDIENDRVHKFKSARPIPSGDLNISSALAMFVICILLGVSLASSLKEPFQVMLISYGILTFAYSKFLKKIVIIDVLTLSTFYTIRIISGTFINPIFLSSWLVTFSIFFFLFLALIKRQVEIKNLQGRHARGTGYSSEDYSFLKQLSLSSGLISVLIVYLYLDSDSAKTIYANSEYILLAPAILLYWILETLFKAHRNKVSSDPIIYALKNKSSYICLILMIFCVVF